MHAWVKDELEITISNMYLIPNFVIFYATSWNVKTVI